MGFLMELIFDGVVEGWFFLMQRIVPDSISNRVLRNILKLLVGVTTCILFLVMLLGCFALFSDDPYTKQIGRFMVFIPLGVSALQILLGIVVRSLNKRK